MFVMIVIRRDWTPFFSLCIDETSRNPIEIVRKMMDASFCHMHGPEHHVMVGAALLTAYKNAGGAINLRESCDGNAEPWESRSRRNLRIQGACGAGISAGMFVSILSGATPLTEESLGPFESDDIKSTGSDFAHRRSEVL